MLLFRKAEHRRKGLILYIDSFRVHAIIFKFLVCTCRLNFELEIFYLAFVDLWYNLPDLFCFLSHMQTNLLINDGNQ